MEPQIVTVNGRGPGDHRATRPAPRRATGAPAGVESRNVYHKTAHMWWADRASLAQVSLTDVFSNLSTLPGSSDIAYTSLSHR